MLSVDKTILILFTKMSFPKLLSVCPVLYTSKPHNGIFTLVFNILELIIYYYFFQWMKVDEVVEQERVIKAALSSRAGVLGLLLHSTKDHEKEERERRQMAAYMHQQNRKIVQQQQNVQMNKFIVNQNPTK